MPFGLNNENYIVLHIIFIGYKGRQDFDNKHENSYNHLLVEKPHRLKVKVTREGQMIKWS